MTDTATQPAHADAWTQQLDALKTRYRHVREPVLAALNILLHEPSVDLDDAKARAQVHGVRITAASVAAARRLIDRMDGAEPKPARKTPAAARRPRAASTATDPEALIRGLVTKLQDQENAEAERLRAAMRKAVSVLQAAVGDR